MKKEFPEKRIVVDQILPNLKGEGFFEGKSYSFPYANINDEVVFEERGRGKRKHFVVKEIVRNAELNSVCEYFSKCGGCSGQHISYEKQFFLKTEKLSEIVKNRFRITPSIVPSEEKYYYRNRMDFAVFPEKIVGLHQSGNFRKVIDIEYCHLQNQKANDELKNFKAILSLYPEIIYNRKTEEGFLKYATYRRGIYTSDDLFILTFTKGFENTELEKKFEELVLKNLHSNNIVFCYNRKKAEVSASGEFKTIRGNHFYEEKLFGKHFQIPFDSFFQPNPKGFLPILHFIQDRLHEKNEILVDLFSGSGFFSKIFGEYFSEIFGYDFVESSILEAEKNLKKTFPEKKIRFEKINLFSEENFLFKEIYDTSRNILILDPPRSGAGERLSSKIRDTPFSEIFYVSCNPESQLKDLSVITEKFDLKMILFTDPYPQTPHIESVAHLQRKLA